VSKEIVFGITLDLSKTKSQLANANFAIDKTVKDWAKQYREMRRQISHTRRMMGGLVTTFRGVFQMMGGTLGPIENALINVIYASFATAEAVADTAAATVVGIPFSVYLRGVSLAISVIALGQAIAGVNEAERNFNNINLILSGLSMAAEGRESEWGGI
jgi:hypothetical protein